MKNYLKVALFIIGGYMSPHFAAAADTVSHKYPRVVLVQLRSEHNRIDALTKQNRLAELKKVKEAAVDVQKHMIADFTDNFHYCPVYYYMDTNQQRVKAKQFSGILTNGDGTPAPEGLLSDTSKDYLIVFYGYPTSQSRIWKKVKDSSRYSYNSGEPFGQGLIINNHKYEQVSYLYKFRYEHFTFDKRYKFESKTYDMEYMPFAKLFNSKLLERESPNKKVPITHHHWFD